MSKDLIQAQRKQMIRGFERRQGGAGAGRPGSHRPADASGGICASLGPSLDPLQWTLSSTDLVEHLKG